MAAKFHLFGNLPAELRDEIWDMAIRDSSPGVHVFSVLNMENANSTAIASQSDLMGYKAFLRNREEESQNDNDDDDTYYCAPDIVGIAAPDCSDSSPPTFSWTRDNFSTYMEDSGLWTACWESRCRMEWHFKTQTWAEKRLAERQAKALAWYRPGIRDPEMQVTGYFQNEGKPQYFNIRPQQDLIVLRLRGGVFAFDPREDIPFFSSYWGIAGAAHVALEIGPGAGVDWLDNLCMMCGRWVPNLWLINYKLKMSPDVVPAKDDADKRPRREVFRAGDRKFVEVLSEEDYDNGTLTVEPGRRGRSIAGWARWHGHLSGKYNPFVEYGHPWVRVLACIPDA
ncbi:hypothetical protein M426DRAFT_317113 [Hypoxylon sp. CI-4A]|nr:hypothetical protein M426DRAFT_317113 [Hypoxylon sp. CI-4A]